MADAEPKVEDDVMAGEEDGDEEVCYFEVVTERHTDHASRRRSDR
jgi:hypothetical protein